MVQTRTDISISRSAIRSTQAVAAYKISGVIWKDGDGGEGVNEGIGEVVDIERETNLRVVEEVTSVVEIVSMAEDCMEIETDVLDRPIVGRVVEIELHPTPIQIESQHFWSELTIKLSLLTHS